MADDVKHLIITQFNGGISDSEKIGIPGSYGFGRNLDIHTDPNKVGIMVATRQESPQLGAIPKWIVSGAPWNDKMYAYLESGAIWERDNNGTWTLSREVANSNGQGMVVSDDYLYYAQNNRIGRLGPLSTGGGYDDIWQLGLDDTSATGFAPMMEFSAGFVCGHGNKVAYWDGGVFEVNKLILPVGLYVRALALLDEYIAIGCWKGGSITESEIGDIFQWDGVQPNYNFNSPIDEGGVNALINSRNRLFSIVGSSGQIYQGVQPYTKVQQLPKLTIDKYVEIWPGAVTNWRGYALIGAAADTDSTEFEHGIYRWGSKSDRYAEVLDLPFTPDTGFATPTGTSKKIGALLGVGNQLFIGYDNGTECFIDNIDAAFDNSPFEEAYKETLLFDAAKPHHDKRAMHLKATHLPLRTGESIQVHFQKNRGTYSDSDVNSTADSTFTKYSLSADDQMYTEGRAKVTLGATGTTSPWVTSLVLEFDDGSSEELL